MGWWWQRWYVCWWWRLVEGQEKSNYKCKCEKLKKKLQNTQQKKKKKIENTYLVLIDFLGWLISCTTRFWWWSTFLKYILL